MPRISRRALVAVFVAGWACLPTAAQEVGRFAVVQNQVTTTRPGAPGPVQALEGAAIYLNDVESSGPDSRAKMTFGGGAVVSIGENAVYEVSQEAVDEVTGASVSTIDLTVGRLRVFVSRFWGSRPEVRIETPVGTAGVKGSEVLVDALQDGSTEVTVFTGSAVVGGRAQDGTRVLTAGQQIRVSSLGQVASSPTEPDAATLEELWNSTEPNPRARRKRPAKWPVLPTPKEPVWPGIVTDCFSCTPPVPPEFPGPGPGASPGIITGSKASSGGSK